MNQGPKSSFWNRPQGEGTLITDLSRCEPRTAISKRLKDGCWYTLAYETTDGIRGALVGKGELSRPPAIRLSLEAAGWHAVYLGLYRGGIDPGKPFEDSFALNVRFSDERLFDMVRPSIIDNPRRNSAIEGSGGSIEEMFWKASDLNGQQLVISYPFVQRPTAGQLAFVRLVPMTQAEIDEYTRTDPSTRILAAQFDGHSGSSFFDGAQTADDLLEIYEPLRYTDVGKLFLGTGGVGAGSTFYQSKVGVPYGAGAEAFVWERGRRTVQSIRGFLSQGIDPVKERVEYVKAMGIAVYLGFRMGTMATPPPNYLEPVPFWREHPELRCRDIEGNTIARLSMAYPEVRKFYVDLLLELTCYNVDGVQLIYTRRGPYALFEPPVIDDFKKAYGIDPRELSDNVHDRDGIYRDGASSRGTEYGHDERLESLWARYVTTFMHELRQALDTRSSGKRLEVVANVFSDADSNRASALDLHTWAARGLVDILVPVATPATGKPVVREPVAGGSADGGLDFGYFRDVVKGTECVFYPDINPRHMPAGDYVQRAKEAYAKGAAGLAFWDSDRRIITKSQWNTIRRLGHRTELDDMAQGQLEPLMHRLRLVDGWNPSHYT